MAQTLKTIPDVQIDQLISTYDGMVDELYSQIYQLGYNHARTGIFYHSSIIHTTKRLNQGVPYDQLCPAYEAFQSRGFFACEQEYLGQWVHVAQRLTTEHQEKAVNKMKGVSRAERSLDDINEIIESLARLIACGSPDCSVTGCQNETRVSVIIGACWVARVGEEGILRKKEEDKNLGK